MNAPKYEPPLAPELKSWFNALTDDADGLDFYLERAAIREVDGKLTRIAAERAAKLETDAYIRQRQRKTSAPKIRRKDQQ